MGKERNGKESNGKESNGKERKQCVGRKEQYLLPQPSDRKPGEDTHQLTKPVPSTYRVLVVGSMCWHLFPPHENWVEISFDCLFDVLFLIRVHFSAVLKDSQDLLVVLFLLKESTFSSPQIYTSRL